MRIVEKSGVADNTAVLANVRTFQGRKRKRRQYVCSCCKYKSIRQFNVTRHERRIHAPRPYARICCDELFYTKGEYYLHVEKVHPEKRMTAVTSRKKYKILKNMSHISRVDYAKNNTYTWVEKTVHTRRYSTRLRQKYKGLEEAKIEITCENSSFTADDLEDVPLIYFLRNEKLKEYMKSRWSENEVSSSQSCTASYHSTILHESHTKKEEFDLEEELNNNRTNQDHWQEEILEDCRHDVLGERQILRIIHTQENVEFENDRFSDCCDFNSCKDEQNKMADHPAGQFGAFPHSQDHEEQSERSEALDTDLLANSEISSLMESRTSSLTGSMTGLVTESLTGSLTISQTISQTITQTSSLTCSLDTASDAPLKMRMLKECLPLKKRRIQSFESIGIDSFWQTSRNNSPKRKWHPKKSCPADICFDEDKENEKPRETNRKTSTSNDHKRVCHFPNERSCEFGTKNPMNITFENLGNLPIVTQYHREFLEFIDFDMFRTF